MSPYDKHEPEEQLAEGTLISHLLELRSRDTCSAIVTQSAGLPDDPTRWNLVLFSDRLRRPLAEVIRRPRRVGVVRLRA